MAQHAPEALPGFTAAAARYAAEPARMVRWTDRGPYRIQLDDMLTQATDAVLARPELTRYLEVVQNPPDLPAIVSSQRSLIVAAVTDIVARADVTAMRLRDRLFDRLLADPRYHDEAEFLTDRITWLGVTIGGLQSWNPAMLDSLPDDEAAVRADTLLQIVQAELAVVSVWISVFGGHTSVPQARPGDRNSPVLFPPRGELTVPVFVGEPAERRGWLRYVLASCQALDIDLREALERRLGDAMIHDAPPLPGQGDLGTTLETEWRSQQREVASALEKAILAVALTALNEAVEAANSPRMTAASLDGLRSALSDDKVVVTAAFEDLAAKLRQRSEGSFGIAGPRGVGKTTLIRYLTTGPGLPPQREDPVDAGASESDADEAAPGRPKLGVLVSAPVRYDAREFVLYLYGEICKTVYGPDAEEMVSRRIREAGRDDASSRATAWRTGVPILAAAGAGLLAAGGALLGWAIRHATRVTPSALGMAGAALLTAAALVALLLLWRLLDTMFRINIGPMTIAAWRSERSGRTGSGAGRSSRIEIGRSSLPEAGPPSPAEVLATQAAAFAVVVAVALLLSAGGWPGGTLFLAGGIALIVAGVLCLRLGRQAIARSLIVSTLSIPGGGTISASLGTGGVADSGLRELALRKLFEIWVQQTFTSEWSRTATLAGPSAFPSSLAFDAQRGTTSELRERSYPELVGDIRDFLGRVAEKCQVVIGIDELDKLRTADTVEEFLNDVKGIFGAPGCYYLVSVSEDAAAGFERRGAPFRDVFDSSFDDVISLQPLDLTAARKILHGLLLGWTEPFVGLCYVLSGGLPRDLWRVAHELVAQRDDANQIDLGKAAEALCQREGESRLRAIRHELTKDPLDPDNATLLGQIADISLTDPLPDLLRCHDDLRAWADVSKAAALTDGDENQTLRQPGRPAVRLALELAAFLLFAVSVVQFYDDDAIADRLAALEAENRPARSLAALAASRQLLAQSPASALAALERFRAGWSL